MKKFICLLTVLVLCMSLVVPAFAAEGDFVPSITYKPNPEIVPVPDAPEEDTIGVIRNKDGEIIDYVGRDCLMVTPIAHVWDEEIEVAPVVEELLLFVYGALNDGSMTIPYEKHEADLNADNMVIRDLFDAKWVCEEHRKMVEEEGVTFEITFDLGVVADAEIFVMTYDEETKEWDPIVKTVNNGDGTVTCTFEHLCAIEFSMPIAAAPSAPSENVEPGANTTSWCHLLPWFILLLLAIIAIIVIIIAKKKKEKEKAKKTTV